MNSIFDIVGERFFVPLASKNRKLYMDTILFLHSLINDLFQSKENDKSRIVQSLADHLDDKVSIHILSEDSDEEIDKGMDSITKASYLINKLEDYGWLLEEAIGDGKRAIDFNNYSYNFIALIEELTLNRKPQYTSYVKNINNAIDSFDYSKIDDLQIIDKSLNEFIVELRGLRASIQRFYKNIVKNKDLINLKDLLEEFVGDYKEYFLDKSYLNLKIRDNVDGQIPQIEDKLESIFNDDKIMNKLISSIIDKENKNYDDVNEYIMDCQKRIMTNVRTIPSLIKMIDSKNKKYVSRTISVIEHLITRGEDIVGVLHRLIDYVKDNDINNNYLSIFEMKHYTFNALSRPRIKSQKVKPEPIKIDYELKDEVKAKALEILQEDKKYSIKSVNSFVLGFLKDYQERNISQLEIKGKYEFIMIISIMIFSKLPNALYELEMLDERVTINGISFNDFKLRIKGV